MYKMKNAVRQVATVIPAVKGEYMTIVLWYLNIVCTEAGSMFISCLGEPV